MLQPGVLHSSFRAICRRAPSPCFRATTPPKLRDLSLLVSVGLSPTGCFALNWTRRVALRKYVFAAPTVRLRLRCETALFPRSSAEFYCRCHDRAHPALRVDAAGDSGAPTNVRAQWSQ